MNQDEKEQIEETEDPIHIIYTNLINGEHKEHSLLIVEGIENAIKSDAISLDEEMLLAINHIFASVYTWNNKFQDAERLHNSFLANEQWCINNKEIIESYLIISLAKNNTNFINKLWQIPIVQNNFNYLYKAYLGSIVDKNSEEHFNMDLLPYYQKLLTAQKLYCQE